MENIDNKNLLERVSCKMNIKFNTKNSKIDFEWLENQYIIWKKEWEKQISSFLRKM